MNFQVKDTGIDGLNNKNKAKHKIPRSQLYAANKTLTSSLKDTHRLRVKMWQKALHAHENQRKSGVSYTFIKQKYLWVKNVVEGPTSDSLVEWVDLI